MNEENDLLQRVIRLESELAEQKNINQRLSIVEDQLEIERLQRMYGYYLDNRMWDGAADLFAEEGASIEIGRRGKYAGKEKVRSFFLNVLGRGRDGLLHGEIINHMQLQGVVNVDPSGEIAKGRWRAFIQGSPAPGETTMVSSEGVYENTYVKENGQWKIASMWWAATFYVNIPGYESVYFNSTPPDKDFLPDAPSEEQVAALGRSFLPFHYKHPITEENVPLVVNESSDDHIGYKMDEE